jgi:hypothetical protein
VSEASEATQFQPGNQMWKLRERPGRRPIYETPEDLWIQCCKYFQWVEENPLIEIKLFKFKDEQDNDFIHQQELPKMRAMTNASLCFFLGVTPTTWMEYRIRPAFTVITREVDDIIYSQKLEGAASELFNANIIARELGLRDHKDHVHAGGITHVLTETERVAKISTLLERAGKRRADDAADNGDAPVDAT